MQIAISWVVDNYNRVAEWYASARRVMDIVDACDAIDPQIDEPTPADAARRAGRQPCALADFEIADGSGRPLISGADLSAAPGEAVHIHGDSSTGKSMLVRVLAGLWPAARGSLALPDRSRGDDHAAKELPAARLPQGRAALSQSRSLQMPDDAPASRARPRSASSALGARLDEVARWDQVLSNGERQRLAIARLIVHRPQVVILDDALSALEEAAQAALLARLRDELPDATIVSLAQRPAPSGVHDRQLVLERRADSATLLPRSAPALADAK